MRKLLVTLAMVEVLALLLSIPAQAQAQTQVQAAYGFYVTVQGEKQGKFKSDTSTSETKVSEGKILGVRFQYGITVPTDPRSGLPSGKHQHQPVVITKKWGISSPQFFRACVSGETLKFVTIEFIHTGPRGDKYIFQVIRLADAKIVSIRQYANMLSTIDPLATTRPPEFEDITFIFKKIEILNKDGNTTAEDDWSVPSA